MTSKKSLSKTEYLPKQKLLESLFKIQKQSQIIFQSIDDAVITTNVEGKIEYLNPIAEKLTGWKLAEARNKPFGKIVPIVHEYTRQLTACPIKQVVATGKTVSLPDNHILIASDGTKHVLAQLATPVNLQGKLLGVVVILHDITESRQLARQLSWQAKHDVLTRLPNRKEFEQQTNAAIASASQHNHQHALCLLDLDQFRVVNDICGHVAGDELLQQITNLLQQGVRNTDVLARLGGDEFGLLLHQCPIAEAEKIANTLRQLIQTFRFTWKEKTFALGVSVGLVPINADSQDFSSILSIADAACYAAKKKGRNCIQVYHNNDSELVKQRDEQEWIFRINQALQENRFCLYCQKIAPLKEGVGKNHYEILLRLLDEDGNIVPPMAFIPAAERYNLMPAIDRWVISTFFARYANYCQSQLDCLSCDCQASAVYTINLSGASINNDQFMSFVREQFSKYPISPSSICFEITETTAIANLTKAADLIYQLKELGCSFALDDFGSGMSSLAYLKNLPVDYLKIDGSFVKNIIKDTVDRVTVECFNRIGHVMNIQTIAEFVENEAIIDKLKELGVDYGQGYGINRPSPLSFTL